MTLLDLFQALIAVELLSLLVAAWGIADAVRQTHASRKRPRR